MKSRGRPRKKKTIQEQPRLDQFNPSGRPGEPETMIVSVEEYEAIRLYDYKALSQKQAAKMMDISQQSFSRLVRQARGKIADALVNAKIIQIKGGDYQDKRSMLLTNKLRRKPLEKKAPHTEGE